MRTPRHTACHHTLLLRDSPTTYENPTNDDRYTVTIGGRDGMDWIGWGGSDIDGKGTCGVFYIGRRGQAYQHYTGNQGRQTPHVLLGLGDGVWWN